jgi:hypothetical protein
MRKVLGGLLLALVIAQPAFSADAALGTRPVSTQTHIYLNTGVRRVELNYPRFVPDHPKYSCWHWTPDGRVQLAPLGLAQCAAWPYQEGPGRVLFVEHIRVY